METYEIYLNGSLVSSTSLGGIAVMRFESARLLGSASLILVSDNPDPVLGGRYSYDADTGGWEYAGPCETVSKRPTPVDPSNTDEPPICVKDCRFRQKFTGFTLQRNALRSELASMVAADRCGWNLKPGHIGGHPLDYAPCDFPCYGGK